MELELTILLPTLVKGLYHHALSKGCVWGRTLYVWIHVHVCLGVFLSHTLPCVFFPFFSSVCVTPRGMGTGCHSVRVFTFHLP